MPDLDHGTPRVTSHSVAIISPKVPFLEWAQQAYAGDGVKPTGLPSQPRAFLIPHVSDHQEGFDYIQVICASIFAEMLAVWQSERSTWPTGLDSCTQFTAWFDIQIVQTVVDLDVDEPIIST